MGEKVMPDVDALPVVKELPDPFRFMDGSVVKTKADWQRRRAEIIAMLEYYEYGHMPPAPVLHVIEESATPVFDGKALDIRATVAFDDKPLRVHMGMFVPQGVAGKKYPAVIETGAVWGESMRDAARLMIERGYIFAGYDRHEIDKDDADRSDGVHPLYPGYDWATLAAWAWGAQRTLDYLLTRPEVDATRVAVTGHSRGGKTALWAGALDERFALVVPHASGAGGAGCFRIMGAGSESLEAITAPTRFHYWFQPRLATFARRETL
jgi:dienelactone hydrolase